MWANNQTHLASRLEMNVSVLGYNDVPTPRFGRVYKIKNLWSTIEGAMYSFSIKQYPQCTCPNNEVKNSTRTKEWVPCKHLYWIYNVVLDTTKYCTYQPTITRNEVMDMLKIWPQAMMGFFSMWLSFRRCLEIKLCKSYEANKCVYVWTQVWT